MHYQKRLNPYNRSRGASPRLERMRAWLISGASIALGVALLALLPFWHIRAVELTGAINPDVSIEETLGAYLDNHRGTLTTERNLIFLKSKNLKTNLQTAYNTDTITVKKQLPNRIVISMSDTGASAVFIARGKTYALDQSGKITGPASRQAPGALTVYDSGASLPAVGAEAVRPEFMQFLGTMQHHEAFRGYRIQYALSPRPTDESTVTIAVDKGFRIIVDATADLAEQLGRMNRIVSQVVGPSKLSTLDYIDLRFKEKVFYKTK